MSARETTRESQREIVVDYDESRWVTRGKLVSWTELFLIA